ncbi:MAG: NAD(P)H-dependent oxidoreductase [Thermoleophilia bacterium]|nr:NAD(P)H-dependent oxidoreductase [Thermoleophilia bacterium]
MPSDDPTVLILFAHPALEKSRVNAVLIEAVRDLPGVTFRDLYEAYPDLDIRVEHEQALLVKHDIIVLHHPFYWYSSPSILKEYQDLVLAHGWAYGRGGEALMGKTVLQVITTGGRESAYRRDGINRFTIRELLVPFEQTARLCGMDYLPPFVAHGSLHMTPEEVLGHADDYRRLVEALRDGAVNRDAVREHDRINSEAAMAFVGERVSG